MSPWQLMIVVILGWGVGSFFYKLANTHLHPIWVSCVATIVYLCAAPINVALFKPNHSWDLSGVIYAVLGAGFMCSGTLTYFFLLQKGNVGEVTAMSALYPALTLTLAFIFLDENFSVRKMFGIIFAIISIWLLGKK